MQNKLVNFTKQSIFDLIKGSIFAGLLIAIAGIFYVRSADPVIGSILFGLGLTSVIILDANLFTGKIGYVNSLQTATEAGIILVFNLLAAAIVGLLYHYIVWPIELFEVTRLIKDPIQMFYRGLICGVCIYLAVELYKRTKNLIPVFVAVAAFILTGGTHCIADTFYFFAGPFSWAGLGYVGLTILGNTFGAILMNLFVKEIKVGK